MQTIYLASCICVNRNLQFKRRESEHATAKDGDLASKSFLNASKLFMAQGVFQPKDKLQLQASLYINMAILCKNRGKSDKALDYLETAMQIAESKDLENYSLALLNTIYTLQDCKDYIGALDNTQLYKAISKEHKNILGLVDCFDIECETLIN